MKEFGFIKLFRKDFKKEDSRHYILYLPDEEKLDKIPRSEFIRINDIHCLRHGLRCNLIAALYNYQLFHEAAQI